MVHSQITIDNISQNGTIIFGHHTSAFFFINQIICKFDDSNRQLLSFFCLIHIQSVKHVIIPDISLIHIGNIILHCINKATKESV